MEKTFIKITTDSKDVVYRIGTGFVLRYCYNSISNTYMGFRIESFVDYAIPVVKMVPDLLQLLSYCSANELEAFLKENGFQQIDPTYFDISIYNK